MKIITDVTTYLELQDIRVSRVLHGPSIVDVLGGDQSVAWSPYALRFDEPKELSNTQESMSLASMAAVHQLELEPGVSVLDLCAAPGMKGLYAKTIEPSVLYTANDVSMDRLGRLKRLFTKHSVAYEQLTNIDSRFADKFFAGQVFDRVIIDAPCSGEGVILGGDDKLLKTWSTAKVKRLQQIQIRILKSAWSLLKPGGRLVYATCTLNKNENERVVKKALGVDLSVTTDELSLETIPKLRDKEAWRILPSDNSIGFFVAVLDKPNSSDLDQL